MVEGLRIIEEKIVSPYQEYWPHLPGEVTIVGLKKISGKGTDTATAYYIKGHDPEAGKCIQGESGEETIVVKPAHLKFLAEESLLI